MPGIKYAPIDPVNHSLFSIYGYPKFGTNEDRIRESATSRDAAQDRMEELKKMGYTKLMIVPVRYQHDKEYRPRENVTSKRMDL